MVSFLLKFTGQYMIPYFAFKQSKELTSAKRIKRFNGSHCHLSVFSVNRTAMKILTADNMTIECTLIIRLPHVPRKRFS